MPDGFTVACISIGQRPHSWLGPPAWSVIFRHKICEPGVGGIHLSVDGVENVASQARLIGLCNSSRKLCNRNSEGTFRPGLSGDLPDLHGDLFEQIARLHQAILYAEPHIRFELVQDTRDRMQASQVIFVIASRLKGQHSRQFRIEEMQPVHLVERHFPV